MDITSLGILECQKELEKKTFSILEIVSEFIKKKDQYNVFITNCHEKAVKDAKLLDLKLETLLRDNTYKKNKELLGSVIAVKDIFCTKGIRTTCASKILSNFIPDYESTVTEKIIAAGALIIGKTNMDEFAMGSSNKTSYFGPVINPLKDKSRPNSDLVPGGSSGGSAVAVLADYCHASLGTDTGGSIKQPASFCGIVGLRPSYGRCSRYGMISYASSLDQAGIFAKNVDDAAYLLEYISGQDSKDSTTLQENPISILKHIQDLPLDKPLSGMSVGILEQCKSDKTLPSINTAWEKAGKLFEKKGAKIVPISLDYITLGAEVYYTVTTAEAFSNLARYDGVKFGYRANLETNDNINDLYIKTRSSGFGDEVKRRIALGAYVLSAQNYEKSYIRAAKIRRLIANSFANAFEKVNIILTPTTPNVAFAINDEIDVISMYLNDIFTIPSNLAGLAGINIPCTSDIKTGLPIGMQLIPKAFDEITMFKFAKVLEDAVKNNEI
jgi:aspartyl-tRNA(Asn)/glutamyl-tRNA(Gln) amidotransferase subunit A